MNDNELRENRTALLLTQADMAVFLNVSRLTFIKWEKHVDLMPLGKYKILLKEYSRLVAIKENIL
jgi:DNA-binding XRE family transcriptional regulator